MTRRKHRKFTPAQKAQAVRIVRESGKSVREVANELDLPASSLGRHAVAMRSMSRSWPVVASCNSARAGEAKMVGRPPTFSSR